MGKRKTKSRSISGQDQSFSKEDLDFDSRLATIIMSKRLVTSPEEALCLAETIVSEMKESDLSKEEACISSLEDYFSLSRDDAREALSSLFNLKPERRREDDLSEDSNEESFLQGQTEEIDDDGDYVGEGECELCERLIRLTKHHLIPRSTWPRILPRFTSASIALSKNDPHRAGIVLGPGLLHLLDPLTRADGDKAVIKDLLRTTCTICRSCHNHIHNTYSNMTLATDYSTIELMLSDEKIYKYCKWASKQKAGKYAL